MDDLRHEQKHAEHLYRTRGPRSAEEVQRHHRGEAVSDSLYLASRTRLDRIEANIEGLLREAITARQAAQRNGAEAA